MLKLPKFAVDLKTEFHTNPVFVLMNSTFAFVILHLLSETLTLFVNKNVRYGVDSYEAQVLIFIRPKLNMTFRKNT